jgi:PAS domain S-box-containing protein
MPALAFGDAPIAALSLELVEALLDHLPRAPFFVKDRELRYVSANAAMLELCGVRRRDEFIGRSAREFFPEAMWRRYEALDLQVMRSGRPVTDQLHLSVRMRGRPVWLLFGRWPVTTEAGDVVGIAAMARALEAPDRRHPTYERLAIAVEHIQANFGAPLDVPDLARRAGVSVSQLERDFVSLFGLPPRGYLTKVRLEAALAMLDGDKPIVEIAHACGYGDQSAFTRRFHAAVGISPTEYRRSHAPPK